MTKRMIRVAALAAIIAIAPAHAQTRGERPIVDEVAAVIERVVERAPFRTWDDLRLAAPRGVHWHLAPPDEGDAERFRRSGWLEANGEQAGIAACGPREGPAVVTLRVNGATWRQVQEDPVIAALRRSVGASLVHHEPTMVGEVERFELHAQNGGRQIMQRVENCSREGGASRQRCDTTYTLDVRPEDADARRIHHCPAP